MSLFRTGNFTLHSGERSPLKIDCDALTSEDWQTITDLIVGKFRFSRVEGVRRGGTRLAHLLGKYQTHGIDTLLIVDDVLRTGGSMEEQRAGRDAIGVVVFARGPCPDWVKPIFTMWE